MGDIGVNSYYILQKPVFDREIKAPKVRKYDANKECNDRYEKNVEMNNELSMSIRQKLSNNMSKTILTVVGISGLLALIPEVFAKLKK